MLDTTQKTNKKPSRHQTRFVCIQAIVSALLTNFQNPLEDTIKASKINIDKDFCNTLYKLVYEHGAFFTELLTKHIQNKPFADIDITLQAIFYCALSELFYVQTDKKIVISEYVILTKRFMGENHYKLVHKVLDTL